VSSRTRRPSGEVCRQHDLTIQWTLNAGDPLLEGRTIEGILNGLGRAHTVPASPVTEAECRSAYLGWANDSVRMLEHRVSTADISRLVLTSGYERILTATGILTRDDTATQGALSGLLRREIERQGEILSEAIKELQEQILRWPPNHLYAVADTSFYIDHEHKLEDIDLADHVHATWRDKVVTLIVPIIVLDELDGLKNRGPNHHVKWRAGHTLGVFDRIFAKPGTQGILQQPADGRGGIVADVFFDPAGHERLPIADDEIIDRALAAQGLTGTTITLLTFDTGQAARARNAGLAVSKLTRPLGPEPEDQRKKKA
jgi:PIN domain